MPEVAGKKPVLDRGRLNEDKRLLNSYFWLVKKGIQGKRKDHSE